MRSFWRFWRARTSFAEGIGRKRYSRAAPVRWAAGEPARDHCRAAATGRRGDHPDRAAFVEVDRRLTFAEWDRAADGVAAFFAGRGSAPGDVVALLVPSSIEYAVCYQAAMRLRAITTGINPRLGPPEIASILERTQPRVVVRARRPRRGARRVRERPARARSRVSSPTTRSRSSGRVARPACRRARCSTIATSARSRSARARWARAFDVRLAPLPFAHVAFMSRPWEEIENVDHDGRSRRRRGPRPTRCG